jgi:diguanylate cyclase (GGDEF)-like protein
VTSTLFVEALRLLGLAATQSVSAVRTEIDRAIRAVAPAIDSVLIFDEHDGELVCVSASGARVSYFRGVRLALGDEQTLPSLALMRGRRAVKGESGIQGFYPADAFAVAIPLASYDGRRSVVYAASTREVDDPLLEEIVPLADHAGFAYVLAHEREAQQQRAEYDALTGLLTPSALRERLTVMIDRARFAPRARIALLFIDTDYFKSWNDTFGHASGDALLRAIARVLQRAAEPGDIVARNGGDEFCLVFADAEKSQAVERADALRLAIASMDVALLRPSGDGQSVAISASIGVAAFPADAQTPSTLLERADEAMYHCKRTGRNGVSYADPGGEFARTSA